MLGLPLLSTEEMGLDCELASCPTPHNDLAGHSLAESGFKYHIPEPPAVFSDYPIRGLSGIAYSTCEQDRT